jgi:putative ABC transport system permease protein
MVDEKPQQSNNRTQPGIEENTSENDNFLEFLSTPSEEELQAYLAADSKEARLDPSEPFIEFLDVVKKDITIAGANSLYNCFLHKRRWLRNFFIDGYRYITSFINSIIDTVFLFFKEKVFRIKTEPEIKPRVTRTKVCIGPICKIIEKEEPGVQERVPEKAAPAKAEKVQFKTLALLSSRMFTSGSTRTILTILGISISIGVILFLISFGYGLQKVVLQRITTEEALLSLVATLPDDTPISSIQAAEIKKIAGVEHLSPLIEYNGTIELETVQLDATLFLIDENYFSLAGLMSAKGEQLEAEEGGIVVSSAVAVLLGLDAESVIGTVVDLTPNFRVDSENGILSDEDLDKLKNPEKKTFIIKDVIEDELTAFAYVLSSDFDTIDKDNFVEVKIKVFEQKQLDLVKEELINQGYIISSISDTVEETSKIFRGIQLVLGFFGLIALIISAIGMLNILTIVLLERTQEIGIMKAIGASSSDIWKIVISDAVIIGFLGGIGGALIGVGTSKVFNFAFSLLARRIGGQPLEIFQTPPGFLMTIIIFSSVIGFITGVWPAIRASRVSPLEAIRYK